LFAGGFYVTIIVIIFRKRGRYIMRKVTWGMLGTATIAKRNTIAGMKEAENCRLYAVAGRNPEKVKQYVEEYGFEKGYYSYDELLDDPEIEAVYIPLPNSLHYEWVLKAVAKKKHVLCEKPMGLNAEQSEKMIAAARENGVLLMEAFAYLHSPYITAIKNEIQQGTIGKITYIESAFLTRGYEGMGLSNIRVRRDTFGGALYDVGCYCTSLTEWLLDEEPVSVDASAEFTDQHIDIHTSAIMKFPSGARASISCGMCLGGETNRIGRFTICGSKGMIISTVMFNAKGNLEYTIAADGKTEVKTVSTPDNYGLEIEQFGRCITDGETPYVSNDFTVMNAKVVEKIHRTIGY